MKARLHELRDVAKIIGSDVKELSVTSESDDSSISEPPDTKRIELDQVLEEQADIDHSSLLIQFSVSSRQPSAVDHRLPQGSRLDSDEETERRDIPLPNRCLSSSLSVVAEVATGRSNSIEGKVFGKASVGFIEKVQNEPGMK